MNYQEQCSKYFAPLDEIASAIVNEESLMGFSFEELLNMVAVDPELDADLMDYAL